MHLRRSLHTEVTPKKPLRSLISGTLIRNLRGYLGVTSVCSDLLLSSLDPLHHATSCWHWPIVEEQLFTAGDIAFTAVFAIDVIVRVAFLGMAFWPLGSSKLGVLVPHEFLAHCDRPPLNAQCGHVSLMRCPLHVACSANPDREVSLH